MGAARQAVALMILSSAVFVGVVHSQSAAPPAQSTQASQSQIQSQDLSRQAEEQLAGKVSHAILMLPYYGVFDNLGYTLQGRTVILQGQVTNPSLVRDAEKAVKRVEGVDKVVNNIQTLPLGGIDTRIRQQVQAAIYGYGPFRKYAQLPVPPIRIIVSSARVTLDGIVDTEADKNICTIRTNQVSDVLSVTNNLRVVKP